MKRLKMAREMFASVGPGRLAGRRGLLGLVVLANLVLGWTGGSSMAASGATSSPHKPARSRIDHIWVNTGEDKVTRDELRAARGRRVANAVWNGKSVELLAGRNEVVSFNLIMEAISEDATGLEVSLSELQGPDGYSIATKRAEGDQLFNFVGRNIEMFYIRYLEIKGVSTLAYNYWTSQDNEHHLPQRFRRASNPQGQGSGTWLDRPDHNKFYPDIAAPLELHSPFVVRAGTNQSIWTDIYVPKIAPPGVYRGIVVISERGEASWRIPVELSVRNFTLPDLPTARTMLYINEHSINQRYLGVTSPTGVALRRKSRRIVDRHYQLAHRHKISLIDDYIPINRMEHEWSERLSGTLFSRERGYDGVGVGVGNNVFSIGTYSTWPWRNSPKAVFWTAADRWVQYFDQLNLRTPTNYFLYLIDESTDFSSIEKWASWMASNPGVGQRLQTLATIDLPMAIKHTPSLDIPSSYPSVAMLDAGRGGAAEWQRAFERLTDYRGRKLFMYNGSRPASGTFALDDDGISPRQLAWIQYKMGIGRWFYWEGTYYDNFQHQMGPTNVFRSAQTFGHRERVDKALGETGLNYNNGDGVLFYPGSDTAFPEESYTLLGPIASLRMKYWRRGLQDHDYLTMAARAGPVRVQQLVKKLVPHVLWEIGELPERHDKAALGDISWSTNPDRWEEARRELADIIVGSPGHR